MPDTDFTPLLLAALGKRIDDPAVTTLVEALGQKPFRSATPGNDRYVVARKHGLEIGATMSIRNRAYWPPRRENGRWVTWATFAFLYPTYRGALPAGFAWSMDDAALSARYERSVLRLLDRVRFHLPPPGDGFKAQVDLGENGRSEKLYFTVTWERDYATLHPDNKRKELDVEQGFFAAWCALNGIVREGRIAAADLDALQRRMVPPSAGLATALGGVLWQGDVKPEHEGFCYNYAHNMMTVEEAGASHDYTAAFGKMNNFRLRDEPMTADTWENYDRIAPRFALRLDQWRRGDIDSRTDPPRRF